MLPVHETEVIPWPLVMVALVRSAPLRSASLRLAVCKLTQSR